MSHQIVTAMINKRRISLNVFFSLLQTGVIGLTYFFLYKFLLHRLGEEQMGVWAIVLSMSSVANMANMGVGTSVIRLTAKYVVNDDDKSINLLIHTSFIFLAGFFLLISLGIYLIAPFWLSNVIKSSHYAIALQLVPYSLAALMINAVASVFISCLDGLQKNFIRCIVYIVSSLLLLWTSFQWVPSFGIIGVAYAQLCQAAFLFFASLIALKFSFRKLGFFPFRWDKTIFKSIFSFGVKEQVISLCQLCFDPLTKSLLSTMGSLHMVTYYEMANRLVIQLRGLLISANQVFIPVFAGMDENATVDVKRELYRKVFSLNFISTILWAVLLASILVPVSKVWIGEYRPEFVISGLILVAGWSMNILSSPAYFSNMGTGRLNDNVVSNICICVVNLLCGYLLGLLFNGYGVIVAWGLALAAGAFYVIITFHRKNRQIAQNVFYAKEFYLLSLGIVYAVLCNFIFLKWIDLSAWEMLTINLLLFFFFCLWPALSHPVVKSLSAKLKLKISA